MEEVNYLKEYYSEIQKGNIIVIRVKNRITKIDKRFR